MSRFLALAALAAFSIPPGVAFRVFLRERDGGDPAWLHTGVACAAATSLIWSHIAGAAWMMGASPWWMALPAAFCLLVGGACALRLRGWGRWAQLAGVVVFAALPALLIAMTAPGLRRI